MLNRLRTGDGGAGTSLRNDGQDEEDGQVLATLFQP